MMNQKHVDQIKQDLRLLTLGNFNAEAEAGNLECRIAWTWLERS